MRGWKQAGKPGKQAVVGKQAGKPPMLAVLPPMFGKQAVLSPMFGGDIGLLQLTHGHLHIGGK